MSSRSFLAAQDAAFLDVMADPIVTEHIRSLEDLHVFDAVARPVPYTESSLVVVAAMHHLEGRRPPGQRWYGYVEPLMVGQLLRLVWSLNDVTVALLGLGAYVTDENRRELLLASDREGRALAHALRELCIAAGHAPTGTARDLKVLLPAPWCAATGTPVGDQSPHTHHE